MIELTPVQRRALRSAAHHLQPVVTVGDNGLSDTVVKEIDRSLAAHELIKVKLYGIERENRDALTADICAKLECAPVQQIGNILVLWRQKPEDDQSKRPSGRRPKPLTKKQAAVAQEKSPRRRSRS
jgi:RNA-binding protein